MSPGKLTDKPYNDLVAAMNRHINPPSSKIRYRYELFSSTRQPGESIASFVTRLQSIGQYCAYGDATAEMLKDAFVFGINDVQVQRRLFQEKEEFSLQTAIEIATTMELSAKDASRIHAKPSLHQASQHVHRVDDKKPKDHKPLKYLFSESRPTPAMASSRIQRWALMLGAYRYSIQHRAGSKLGNADALSRLPLSEVEAQVPIPGDVHLLFDQLSSSIVTSSQIRSWSDKDPTLSRVRQFILSGWNVSSPEPELQPYFSRRDELSVIDGCILWGARVVIPTAGRSAVIEQLHDTHPGINRMKSLARSYVWWPGLDSDIAAKVRECRICQEDRPNPPRAPLHPWEWPSSPWSRLHIDHAGPFMGKLFLIVIDAHSKWIDVSIVNSTSAENTISRLRQLFSTHGLPEQIVSDNAAGFTSEEFSKFVQANGIKHIRSSPYHPSSNGLAERAVQTFKRNVSKLQGPIEHRLIQFQFRYRITPQTTTGRSPSELLMGRRLRSHLDLIHPDVSHKAIDRQFKSCQEQSTPRKFQVNDHLFARNYIGSRKWIPVSVVKITGPVSYLVKTESGAVIRRHVDQLRVRYSLEPDQPFSGDQSGDDSWYPLRSRVYDNATADEAVPLSVSGDVPQPSTSTPVSAATTRRSTRAKRPVQRFDPSVHT